MEFEEGEEDEIRLGPSYDDSLGHNSDSTRTTSFRDKTTSYKECLKNHAVGIGGHAVDGCGEFIPAGEDGTLESLKCAACNCHRNFHRKEPAAASGGYRSFHHHYHHHAAVAYRHGLHVAPLLALPSATSGGAVSELEDCYNYNNSGGGAAAGKKRFRTKFTAEQREKMRRLAARLGWRIQKQDEEMVQEFCNEVGITRHVLKVWMHNNKNGGGGGGAAAAPPHHLRLPAPGDDDIIINNDNNNNN
ncbi:zinc-finger homeodomain protein 2-like [Andrographis paniculata]|uniref:zinc-finger homeodomain protein 2-like n=1 Tax=Andrographis paniculata TaxID=175694 RepID=UPI0021E90F97|nr:zinc-finger homeodomain protein 2-like [Andrographis paniculata]